MLRQLVLGALALAASHELAFKALATLRRGGGEDAAALFAGAGGADAAAMGDFSADGTAADAAKRKRAQSDAALAAAVAAADVPLLSPLALAVARAVARVASVSAALVALGAPMSEQARRAARARACVCVCAAAARGTHTRTSLASLDEQYPTSQPPPSRARAGVARRGDRARRRLHVPGTATGGRCGRRPSLVLRGV